MVAETVLPPDLMVVAHPVLLEISPGYVVLCRLDQRAVLSLPAVVFVSAEITISSLALAAVAIRAVARPS